MSVFRIILNLLLVGATVFLGLKLANDIKGPIEFEEQRKVRKSEVVDKLKEIRTAQIMYKRKYDEYSDNLDSLKQFITEDSVLVLRQIGDPNDSTVVVQKVESWVPVIDSLYKVDPKSVKNLEVIPNSGGDKFKVEAGETTKNKVKVKVFKVSAPLRSVYKGLEIKYFDPSEEIYVGSMTDATTSGNWE